MTRESKYISKSANRPPGSLVHIGEKWTQDESAIYIEYNQEHIDIVETEDIKSIDIDKLNDANNIVWLDIIGIHNTIDLKKLGNELELHPLLLEDSLDTTQSPKVNDYGDHIFIVAKNLYKDSETDEFSTEQISLIVFEDKLISIREFSSPLFKNTRDRLGRGMNIRSGGTDYLMYSLLDEIVDNYFLNIESLGDKIDKTEDDLLVEFREEVLKDIYALKREIIFVENFIRPTRIMINNLVKNRYEGLIEEQTVNYITDLSESLSQISDMIRTYREITANMLDTYMSGVGNKTNEVMKVLTIFSTIFIPLTFIAGVYGMNFKYIPELDWEYSYISFWIVTVVIIGIMIGIFKKRKWF